MAAIVTRLAPGRPQRCVVACDPLRPSRGGSVDRRELGIPVTAVELESIAESVDVVGAAREPLRAAL